MVDRVIERTETEKQPSRETVVVKEGRDGSGNSNGVVIAVVVLLIVLLLLWFGGNIFGGGGGGTPAPSTSP